MTAESDEQTPPRLQDTSERDALPLPLPGSDQPAESAPDEPAPIEEPAPIQEPVAAAEPSEEAAAEEPPEQPAPEPEPEPAAAASGDGAEPEGEPEPSPPPFQPAPSVAGLAQEDEGLPTEVLVGAAFLGGLALAILIRRLGN
jgi:hypothetical protein